MDGATLAVLFEGGLIFGGALVFAVWQLRSVRRAIRERERRERDAAGDGRG
jgi:hypothetical protein